MSKKRPNFSYTARRTKAINVSVTQPRGGIRL